MAQSRSATTHTPAIARRYRWCLLLVVLLGLAVSGRAQSSCTSDSDCLSNELCVGALVSNERRCLPTSSGLEPVTRGLKQQVDRVSWLKNYPTQGCYAFPFIPVPCEGGGGGGRRLKQVDYCSGDSSNELLCGLQSAISYVTASTLGIPAQ